jgi:redox-sensitive bicupin YhaK (pirin superfamily)
MSTIEESATTSAASRPRTLTRRWTVPTPAPTSQSDQQRMVVAPDATNASDPFFILSEDWFSTVGFDWHPHRGFETVTYVIDGELEHKDSTGGHEVLRAGDLQWTTMGRAVLHAELAYERRGVHTLQLWLNSPAALKMGPPSYQNLPAAAMPTIVGEGVTARLFSGAAHGLTGPARTIWPTTVLDATFAPGGRFTHEIPGEQAAFIYVISGALTVGDEAPPLRAGEVAWFDAGEAGATTVELVAGAETKIIAYAAAPIREPVFAYGPFLMNTREEIIQAFEDYQRGDFGPIPTW